MFSVSLGETPIPSTGGIPQLGVSMGDSHGVSKGDSLRVSTGDSLHVSTGDSLRVSMGDPTMGGAVLGDSLGSASDVTQDDVVIGEFWLFLF